ncbi:MAG: hypothetical protein F2839_00540 [Actinobacteria bacterium]|uniref:Unannotated protein n=1 Tax=freshwater metagenome TaxID=449393 RepID=A0A6J5YMS5_9ZZZZ|nr:hypothetical protein [Actinomycetota bacterium]
MPRFILGVLAFALFIYSFVDWLQTPTPRNLSKPVWFLVIALLPIVGPILWLLFGAIRGGGGGWGDDDALAPDDDPSFWRDFDRTS